MLIVAALAGGAFAGPLDPPSAPGSTQEGQINACPATISTSGSYVFTKELTCPGGSAGIFVSAPNVTIDMHGFALVGPGGAGTEVGVNAGLQQVSVRNGIIRDWGGNGLASLGLGEFANLTFYRVGLNDGIGVDITGGTLSDCVIGASGKATGSGMRLTNTSAKHCNSRNNPGAGVQLNGHSSLTDSTLVANKDGLQLGGDGNSVTNVNVSGNLANGIHVLSGSSNNIITGNTVSGNDPDGIKDEGRGGDRITGNTASGNTNDGIEVICAGSASDACVAHNITDNTASKNGVDGISLSGGAYSGSNIVSGNTADSNGDATIAVGDGIHDTTQGGNRISGNTASANAASGIDAACSPTPSCGSQSITDNIASANGFDGAYIQGAGNHITGNTLVGNGDWGLVIFNGLNPGDDVIDGNNISGNFQAFDDVTTGGNSITRNTLSDNTGMGVQLSGHNDTIEDNTVTRNGYGLYISGGGRIRITGNHLGDSVNQDIFITNNTTDSVVADNSVESRFNGVIDVTGGTRITVYRNNVTAQFGGYNTAGCSACDIAPVTTAAGMTNPMGNILN